MLDRDGEKSVIRAIYAASTDSSRWQRVLAAVRDLLGCACVCVVFDRRDRLRHFALDGGGGEGAPAPPGGCRADAQTLVAACACAERGPAAAGSSESLVCPCAAPCQWQEDTGCHLHRVGAGRDDEDAGAALICVRWHTAEEASTPLARGVLACLAYHLTGAKAIADQVEHERERLVPGGLILECLPGGIMVLDADARVVVANRAAREILGEADGLVLREGRLRALRPGDDAQLGELLRTAEPSNSRVLSVPRAGTPIPYTVSVVPLPGEARGAGRGAPAVVVFICDPARGASVSPASLRCLFGLTRAESRIAAALAGGRTLDEISGQLNIARKTARVHLGHVFEKTGTHRQSALVRLVLESTAALRTTRKHG